MQSPFTLRPRASKPGDVGKAGLKRDKSRWGGRKLRELLIGRLAGNVRVPAISTIHAPARPPWPGPADEQPKWSEIDFERSLFVLNESKTGKPIYPLRLAAFALLRQVKRPGDSDYVFSAATGPGHHPGVKRLWPKIVKKANRRTLPLTR